MQHFFWSTMVFLLSTTILSGQSIRFEQWTLDEAFEESAKAGQPLLVFAYFDWDKNVMEMDSVLQDSTLATISKSNFKAIRLPIQLNDAGQRSWLKAEGVNQFPAFIFVNGKDKKAFAIEKGQPEDLADVIDGFETGVKTYYELFTKDFQTALTSESLILGYDFTNNSGSKNYEIVRQQSLINASTSYEIYKDLVEISLNGKGNYRQKAETLGNNERKTIFTNIDSGKKVVLHIYPSKLDNAFDVRLVID